LAWYFGMGEIGELHEIGKPVIIVAVAVHAAGALWQHFVARTDVLRRMLRPVA
jgi:cytochrome b561